MPDEDASQYLTWDFVREKIVDGLINEDPSIGEDTDLTFVDTANPVNWTRLGRTIVGTIITTLLIGVTAIQQAFFSLFASPYEALGDFGANLASALFGLPAGLLDTAAQTSATATTEYGIFAYVIGVGVTLLSLYTVALALEVYR